MHVHVSPPYSKVFIEAAKLDIETETDGTLPESTSEAGCSQHC